MLYTQANNLDLHTFGKQGRSLPQVPFSHNSQHQIRLDMGYISHEASSST